MRFDELFFKEFNTFLYIGTKEKISVFKVDKQNFGGFKFTLGNGIEICFEYGFVIAVLKLTCGGFDGRISKKQVAHFKAVIQDILDKISLFDEFKEFGQIEFVSFCKNINAQNGNFFKITLSDKDYFCAIIQRNEVKIDQANNYEILKNINVLLRFKIAQTELTLEEILSLNSGDLVNLKNMDMIEILSGDKVIALGEFVKVDEKVGVKILEIKE